MSACDRKLRPPVGWRLEVLVPRRLLPLFSQGRFQTRGLPTWVRTCQQVNKTWSYQEGGRFDSPRRWRPVECCSLQIRIRAEPRAPGGRRG